MGSLENGTVIAMRDDGEYNRHSDFQLQLIKIGMEYVKDTPKALEMGRGKPILTVGDYGCSQGLNSALMMQEIFSKQQLEVSARMILVDTPHNDWNSVAKTFHDHKAAISANGARTAYTEMVPGSFFDQCAPDASIDIGTAWSSAHFLSECAPLEGASVEEVLQKMRCHSPGVAQRDLVRFLTSRAREIRPGGIFAAGLLAANPDPDPNSTYKTSLNLCSTDVAAVLARQKLVEEGKLPNDVTGVVPPIHERSRAEMLAAFDAVKEFWMVEELTEQTVAHPAHEQLRADLDAGGGEEALRKYARTITTSWVAALGMLMLRSKASTARGMAEEKKIIEEYNDKMAQIFYEKFRDEPQTVKFWVLRLRRK